MNLLEVVKVMAPRSQHQLVLLPRLHTLGVNFTHSEVTFYQPGESFLQMTITYYGRQNIQESKLHVI